MTWVSDGEMQTGPFEEKRSIHSKKSPRTGAEEQKPGASSRNATGGQPRLKEASYLSSFTMVLRPIRFRTSGTRTQRAAAIRSRADTGRVTKML
jgi:hypothetical protein